jgi:hypothetical protein
MTAILKGRLELGSTWQDVFQGIGTRLGSESQGFAPSTVCMKSSMPLRLRLSGPSTVGIESTAAAIDDQPSVGILKAVGFNPYNPLLAAGDRILPASRYEIA